MRMKIIKCDEAVKYSALLFLLFVQNVCNILATKNDFVIH